MIDHKTITYLNEFENIVDFPNETPTKPGK